MNRRTLYQGAIVQDGMLLLIKRQRHDSSESYWLFPGGGREAGESEEECVAREMREETNLDVRVERLLLQIPDTVPDGMYEEIKTYLCTPIGGEAKPGFEPEEEAAEVYSIAEVRWFPLADESAWKDVRADPITFPQMQAVPGCIGVFMKRIVAQGRGDPARGGTLKTYPPRPYADRSIANRYTFVGCPPNLYL